MLHEMVKVKKISFVNLLYHFYVSRKWCISKFGDTNFQHKAKTTIEAPGKLSFVNFLHL